MYFISPAAASQYSEKGWTYLLFYVIILSMSKVHPGRSEREGISLIELLEMFPTTKLLRRGLSRVVGRVGSAAPSADRCGNRAVKSRKPMPYRCKDCRKHFSVRLGTVMQSSKLSYQKWAIAIYLIATSLKGVSSMKLHRDLKIRQPSAWHLAQRIREGFTDGITAMVGPVEADETFIGDKEKNKHANRKLHAGRGPVGKTAVIGIKDRTTKRVRAAVVKNTDADTLKGFVADSTTPGAVVYTDGEAGYVGLPNH